MKTKLFLLAMLAAAQCLADSACYGYTFDIFRVKITTTDVSPQAQIDAVIETGANFSTSIVTSGQLTPGVSESRSVSIDSWGVNEYTCIAQIKTITLLEKAGVPFGKRIARYVMTVFPSGLYYDPLTYLTTDTSTVSGKVRYDDYDVSDTLTGSINATFTGASISGITSADDGDPFWNLP